MEFLKELVESEREYVDTLQRIMNIWLIPLREAVELKNERILEKEQILKLFSNSEIIFHVHKELFAELGQPPLEVATVANVFNKRVSFLKLFKEDHASESDVFK